MLTLRDQLWSFERNRHMKPQIYDLRCQSPAKSPGSAKSSYGMYTLIETAKQNGVEPLSYLRALFEKAPCASTPEDWEKLLPWNIFKS